MDATNKRISLLRLDAIKVTNPRTRGKKSFRDIVDSIESVGLKRPITVRKREVDEGAFTHDLVCGQGRIEAFRLLGQTEIPVFVIEATKAEALLKGLVENFARRYHTAYDLLRDIGRLKESNYTDADIAAKIGLSTEYVRGIARLLSKGEQRLLRAVDSGQIPLSVAVDIALADEPGIQAVLQLAYKKNQLRGHKLAIARRLIENRRRRGKGLGTFLPERAKNPSAAALMKAFKADTDRKRILVRKADAARNRLLFVTHALRQLMAEEAFQDVVRAEGLDTLPRNLAARISRVEPA
ncbi:ParB N-terminal domain-containing protein [Mesorhizobium sp. M0051]|uniref:ParB/RepB/Spo0J family partition protein n=1 Tax=Mesorhizobium sp. M0051 TaxID=2956862 RepID=UPI003339C989